jgi:SanA protein
MRNNKISKKTIGLALLGAILLIITVSLASFIVIQRYDRYSINSTQDIGPKSVVIVFGGGVTETEPLPLLKDRLNTAKKLYDSGKISKILLSGDNRFLDYNEPAVMYNYMIDLGVSSSVLQVDFAGRSTYETCERAVKIFGLRDAVLVSESTHLPRAMYLCKHFGLNPKGFASDGESASGLQIGQRWREVLARNKAMFNTYIIGEETVLGEPINITSN